MKPFTPSGRRSRSQEAALAGWTARDLRHLYRLAEIAEYEPGDVLVAEGRSAEEFLILTAGAARVVRGARTVGTISIGDHVGAGALLTGGRYESTVVTDRYCRALLLGPRQFLSLLDSAPSFGRMLATALARQVTVPAPRAAQAVPTPPLTPPALPALA